MPEKIKAMIGTIQPYTLKGLQLLGYEIEWVTFGQLTEDCVLPMRDIDWVIPLERRLNEQGKSLYDQTNSTAI